MMHSEILVPSWPFQDNMNSSFDMFEQYDLEFSPSFIIPGDSAFSIMFPDENFQFSSLDDQIQVPFGSDPISDGVEEFKSLVESGGSPSLPSEQFTSAIECLWSPTPSMMSSETSMEIIPMQLTYNSPEHGMKTDNQTSILHLLQVYGEAKENGKEELAGVILRRLSQKASPAGKTWERIAFNLLQDSQNQGYQKQESSKNLEAAFRVFYQMFPYGRFTHFAANSAILEAILEDAYAVHVIDLHIGEGVQWVPMIEAMAQQHRTPRITSIMWAEEENSAPSPWRFEEVRSQLSKTHEA